MKSIFLSFICLFGVLLGRAGDYSTFTGDGGWCWFADPRAVAHAGKTFTGWVTEDGSVRVGVRDDLSGKITSVTLHEKFQRDDHDNPAFLFLPDGRLMAFYSQHGGPEMCLRVTKNPGDISEWTPERVLDLAGGQPRSHKSITYPNPVMLAGESNAIYLFWRGDDWKPNFSKSTDGGATWLPGKTIVARAGAGGDNRPYVKVASDNQSRIHLLFTDGHPRNEPSNSVYYCCFHDGAFFRANGEKIAAVGELPFKPEQADCVYDARSSGVRAWIWDLAFDEMNRPIVAYSRLPKENDHRYHYARWTGTNWGDIELCRAGRWFPQTPQGKPEPEPHYSGGLALDHQNPSVVYVSRPVDGVFEIERWFTSDGGASWKSEAVTTGSSYHNVRPFVVRGGTASGPRLLWENLSGRYIHYTDYRTSIKMDLPVPVNGDQPPLSASFQPPAILSAMERVGDWQLAHPSRHRPTDWTVGAGFAGMMALARISSDAKYRTAMTAAGETNAWKPGPRIYHADDQAIGQTYCELFFDARDGKMIAPLRKNFDHILANPKTNALQFAGEGDVWSWCDALFMSPPTWVRLWKATDDKRYLDYAITNWIRTSEYLYDKEEHLFFRDSTFFSKREANGRKVFWGRGNGWVIAGLARVLEYLPKDHPERLRFENQFKEMAVSILRCQQPDGLWRASLLDPDNYPLKETSGSGFYCFALAWGVNHGLLERAKYEPAIRRAWAALIGCIEPDGKLTHVQPIGSDPKKFSPASTEIYGVGAFLLAGSEVYRLSRP